MFSAPNLSTLHLCSVLASLAFGLVFLFLWHSRRDHPYLGYWGGSAFSYIAVVIGFELVARPLAPLTGSLLYGALPVSNILILAGVRCFDGKRPFAAWMLLPPLLTGGGYALGGTLASGQGAAASAMASHFGACGITASMALFGLALLRGYKGAQGLGRRIAGGALLGYIPGYGTAIIAKISGVAAFETLVTITMVTDQLLLIMLNLGLLAMPGERAMRILKEQAHRDALTGAQNRAWLATAARRYIVAGTGLILIDVDHFKAINDWHGHAAGDAVLVRIVHAATARIAAVNGAIARLGGDEFLILIPGLSPVATGQLAEQLRSCIADPANGLPECTLSVGVARVETGEDALDPAIARADLRLYEAKASGRDRVAM